jgi:hypothetical protein
VLIEPDETLLMASGIFLLIQLTVSMGYSQSFYDDIGICNLFVRFKVIDKVQEA